MQCAVESISSIVQLNKSLDQWIPRKNVASAIDKIVKDANGLNHRIDSAVVDDLSRFRTELAIQAIGSKQPDHSDETLTEECETLAASSSHLLTAFVSGTFQDASLATRNHGSKSTTTLGRFVALPRTKHTYLVNPHSVPMRYFLRSGDTRLTCLDQSRIYADETSSSSKKLLQSEIVGKVSPDVLGGNEVIVDVPAMGLCNWIKTMAHRWLCYQPQKQFSLFRINFRQ